MFPARFNAEEDYEEVCVCVHAPACGGGGHDDTTEYSRVTLTVKKHVSVQQC